jgi:hypothetical protein
LISKILINSPFLVESTITDVLAPVATPLSHMIESFKDEITLSCPNPVPAVIFIVCPINKSEYKPGIVIVLLVAPKHKPRYPSSPENLIDEPTNATILGDAN